MKVLRAKVDWHEEYMNSPSLILLVDEHSMDKIIYTQKPGFYYGEYNGIVSFYAYKSPGEGYGGREFILPMDTGKKKTLKGPWSSRAGVANLFGFGPVMDVTYTSDIQDFHKGYTLYAGHCTVKIVQDFLDKHYFSWHLVAEDHKGEIVYVPRIKVSRWNNYSKKFFGTSQKADLGIRI